MSSSRRSASARATDDAGMVTAELALTLPAVVLVLALVAGAVGYGVLRWKLRRWRAQLGAAVAGRMTLGVDPLYRVLDTEARQPQ